MCMYGKACQFLTIKSDFLANKFWVVCSSYLQIGGVQLLSTKENKSRKVECEGGLLLFLTRQAIFSASGSAQF